MPGTITDISQYMIAKIEAAGITIPDVIKRNMPAVVALLISLSGPVRQSIRGYLSAMHAQLSYAITSGFALARKADYLAVQINVLRNTIGPIKTRIEKTLTMFPMEQVIKQSPDLAQFLKELMDSVPIQIPTNNLTAVSGVGGFDFFAGIQNFRDLSAKIDDLFFRAARAVSLSNYANQANRVVQEQLDKIRVYIEIIDNLNLSLSAATVTPVTLDFANVPVGTEKNLTVKFKNTSTGTVSYTASTGFVDFVIISGKSGVLYSPTEVEIVVNFSPLSKVVYTDTLTLVHDADSPASPVTVSLRGIGV